MTEHIVLFKLIPQVDQQLVNQAAQAVLSMKDGIEGIEEISIGPNTSPENKNNGFEFGFVMRFRNSSYRDLYLDHPLHKKVIQDHLRQISAGAMVFDIES